MSEPDHPWHPRGTYPPPGQPERRRTPDYLTELVSNLEAQVSELRQRDVSAVSAAAIANGVISAVRTVADDDELLDKVGKRIGGAIGAHAKRSFSEWIGDRVIVLAMSAGLSGLLIWLALNGYIGKGK